jgi:hypothetical protein
MSSGRSIALSFQGPAVSAILKGTADADRKRLPAAALHPRHNRSPRQSSGWLIEPVSQLEFSFKVKEDSSLQPQEYGRISRTGNSP